MVFYAAFNSISVISRRPLTFFMLSWVSPVVGWALKCFAQGHSHGKEKKKTKKQKTEEPVRLEPRTPELRSNTLPLSHAGPYEKYENKTKNSW